MFDSYGPPLLVQPIAKEYVSLFSPHEGYAVHYLFDDLILAGYKDGWIFPVTPQQQVYIKEAPMLMVKNSGAVTSRTSTTTKGYAHVFCRENGGEPGALYKLKIFPAESDAEWLLINERVTMIWLQYGEKLQFLGDAGHESERFHYGKLLIRHFEIKENYQPLFDKKADIQSSGAKLRRVEATQVLSSGFNVTNDDPKKSLLELLAARALERFETPVLEALAVASENPD